MPHQWKTFANLPTLGSDPFVPDTMILLTDGSVLVHHLMEGSGPRGKEWFRLTPDDRGQYLTGRWSGPFNMAFARQDFASGILRDGRLFVLAGEYTNEPGDVGGMGGTGGEIFDPVTNSWSAMIKPSDFDPISRDAACCVLADGRVLAAAAWSNFTALWDPATGIWSVAGLGFNANGTSARVGNGDEETWTLLPDGSVLTVNIDKGNPTVTAVPGSEKYLPGTDQWVPAGDLPNQLSFPDGHIDPATGKKSGNIFEIGPALMLPNGTLFAIGAPGHTALYTPPSMHPADPGTWTAGPDILDAGGSIRFAIDAPAVLLPSGQVLLLAGPPLASIGDDGSVGFASKPLFTHIFDPGKGQISEFSPQPPNPAQQDTSRARFLLLPNGQVLLSEAQALLAILSLDSALLGLPDPGWKPLITKWPFQLVRGSDYTISGSQFNGLSQACSYGDDAQMATNYPLVRLTGLSDGTVVFMRTSNFSTLGVATGKKIVSTQVRVPKNIVPGQFHLQVIANGIASDAVTVDILSQSLVQIWHKEQTGIGVSSEWTDWNVLSNAGDEGTAIAMACHPDGRMHAIMLGLNNQVWHNEQTGFGASGAWTGWNRLSNLGDKAKAVALACHPDGRMHAILIGLDDQLWHNEQTGFGASAAWTGWNRLSNAADTAKTVALACHPDGRMHAIISGLDDQIWHNEQTGFGASAAWTGWHRLSSAADKAKVLALSCHSDGRMHAIIIGIDDQIWHKEQTGFGALAAWTNWHVLSKAGDTAKALALACHIDGRMHAVRIGLDGQIWHNEQSAFGVSAAWTGWHFLSIAGDKAKAVALARHPDGHMHAIMLGPDDQLWHNEQTGFVGSALWTGWNFLSKAGEQAKVVALACHTDGRMHASMVGTTD